MRILFITNRAYLPQKVGGAESSTNAMIRALRSRGNSCMVLSGLLSSGSIGLRNRLKRKFFGEKAPVDNELGYPVARAWDAVSAIPEIKEKFSPNVAVLLPSNDGTTNLAAPLVRAGIPVVLHLRDVEFDVLGDPTKAPLAGVIANSHYTAEAFEEKFGMKSEVVLNIVDRDAYEVGRSGDYVTLINPVPKKGRDIGFELAEQNPDIPFLFVEGWRLAPKEKDEMLRRIGRSRNIVWVRRTLDMRKVYARTRVLIVPSQWREAWGRVVAEAHVSGIPVLASRIGGLPESVGNGGMLIEPKDIGEWQNALRSLWDDAETWRRLSLSAYDYGRRPELRVDAIVERYERLLERSVE